MDIKDRLIGFADEASDSIEGQVAALRKLNWSGLELRAVNGKQLVDLTDEEFSHTEKVLKDNGIAVVSVGSNVANWQISIESDFKETKDLVARYIPRAKTLGAKFVRVMSYSILIDNEGRVLSDQKKNERFSRLRWITEEFGNHGLIPVHENCFTYGGLSWEHTIELVENVPGLRLAFDTGNPPIDVDARTEYPYSYQNSYEFYEHVKPYISHVHIKDSWKDENGVEHYTFPGEGKGDVLKIVSDLERSGYTGYYSMEPHMAVVFHNRSVTASDEERSSNFIEYGRRFEKILADVQPGSRMKASV